MTPEWFEIAWVNFSKAILHGTREDGTEVERVLKADERERVYALQDKHAAEMKRLLRELAA